MSLLQKLTTTHLKVKKNPCIREKHCCLLITTDSIPLGQLAIRHYFINLCNEIVKKKCVIEFSVVNILTLSPFENKEGFPKKFLGKTLKTFNAYTALDTALILFLNSKQNALVQLHAFPTSQLPCSYELQDHILFCCAYAHTQDLVVV